MIDTVIVLLAEDQFKVFLPELFYPSADKILSPSFHMGGSYTQARQNPYRYETKLGIYKPRLTLTKRHKGLQRYEITLKVEYSAPKLLFGNNFDELEQTDIPKVTDKLQRVLNRMGVSTTVQDIESARIGAIHYSKNIPLADYTSPSMYLRELAKINMNMKLDVNQTDFRNGGHSLKYRTNKREICFYDKMKDLQKAQFSQKRSEEQDNAIQLDLFSERKLQKPFEVLRMEIRLGDMSNIRKSLTEARVEAKVIYRDLCNVDVSKAVIQSYWSQIRNSHVPMLSEQDMKPEDYFIRLLRDNPRFSKTKLLSYVGVKVLCDSIGLRDLRMLLQRFGYRGWYRLMKDLKDLKVSHTSELLSRLDKAISSFASLKLVDFEGETLNNDKYS